MHGHIWAQVVRILERTLEKLELSSTDRKYDKSFFINQWEPAIAVLYRKLTMVRITQA